MDNTYNLAQWNWIYERRMEGYYLRDFVDFLNMSESAINRDLLSKTPYAGGWVKVKPNRPNLNERRAEFNALAAVPDKPPKKRRARYQY